MKHPESDIPDHEERARARTSVPGVLLIGIGILNIIGGLALLQMGIMYSRMSPAEFRDAFKQANQEAALENWEKQGFSAEQLQRTATSLGFICGGSALVVALVIIYAGVNMRSLSYYGFAVTGSFLAAIPCISPVGCCGLG